MKKRWFLFTIATQFSSLLLVPPPSVPHSAHVSLLPSADVPVYTGDIVSSEKVVC